MQIKRLIKWTLTVAVSLILVSGILLFTLDLGFLKGVVEKRVSEATGRTFSIEGELSIRLGRDLVIRAEALGLGNADWAADPQLLKIEKIQALIDPWSAWDGPLQISQITIDGLAASLQQDDAGRANWQLPSAATPGGDEESELPFSMESLLVTGVDLTFTSPRLDRPLPLRIDRLEQALRTDGQLDISLSGNLSGRPMNVRLAGGPYAHLASGEDITLEGAGSFGSLEVSGNLAFDNIWSPRRPVFDLQMSGPDFKELTEMLGIDGLEGGDLALQASASVIDDGLAVRLAGNLGQFDIDVSSEMPSMQEFANATFEGRIEGESFGRIVRLAGIPGWPDEPYELNAVVRRPDNGLQIERFELSVGQASIDLKGLLPAFPALTGGQIELQASGPDFDFVAQLGGREGWPREPWDVSARLSMPDDGLTIEQFDMSLAGAEVDLHGSIPGFPGVAGAELQLVIEGSDLAPFRDVFGLQSPLTGAFDVAGTLSVIDAQTLLDLQFEIPLGAGQVSGVIGSGEDLTGTDMDFAWAGPDAAALGDILGLPGLSAEPWSYAMRFSVENPAYFEIDRTIFESPALTIEMSGRLGAESFDRGTDLRFSVQGGRLSDFQDLAGDDVSLPEQAFSIDGRVRAAPGAWELDAVSGHLGPTKIDLNGKLGRGAGLAGTDLVLKASGTDPGKMLDVPGQACLPDGPFSTQARIRLGDGRLSISDASLASGALNVKLDTDIPWPVNLSSGRFALDARGVNITRVLPELAGLKLDAGDYEVHADGSWRDGTIHIREGLARIGDSSLTAIGTLDLPPNLSATNLQIGLQSPDLSRLGTIDGERWGTVPLDLETTFSGAPTRFEMERFNARLGENIIRGAFALDFEQEVPEFELRISANTVNLKPFQIEAGEPVTEKEAGPEQTRIIPDSAFPMEVLGRVNGHFSIAADQVLLKRVTLENNALTGEIRDGRLRVNELGTDGYGGRVVATLSLAPHAGDAAQLDITAQSTGLVIDFADQSEEDKQALPPFDIDINLRGTGATVREAAATLNGNVTMNSPGGTVRNVSKSAAKSPLLAQVVSAISPSASRQDTINISCVAAVIKVQDGELLLDPGVAIQSDKMNIFAGGKVGLGDEKLNVTLRTQTRKAANISVSEVFSPYVKLAGTLARPTVTIDPKGTLLSGGAAYLSGGLSILAKKALNQLGGTKDPCADYLAQARAQKEKQ